MANTVLNITVQAIKTNKSGGAHAQGDVCVEDTSNANSVVNNTAGAYKAGAIWVCLEPNGVADNGNGMYAQMGYVPKINLSASASLGDLVKTHTVAKQGVRHAAPFVAGDFAMVLGTGSTPAAWLFGAPEQAAGGSGITMDEADPYGIHHRLDTPDADDDEFDDASIDAAFTQVNPTGSVTWTEANHVLSAVFSGQSANDLGAILKATTLADGEAFETCLRGIALKTGSFAMWGLVITDGTSNTSNAMALMVYLDFAGAAVAIEMWKGTLTNIATSGTTRTFSPSIFGNVRLKILRNSSTSFSPLVSTPDGAQFNAFGAAVMDPGFTPTHAGLFVTAWGGGTIGLASFDYLRVTA